MSAKNQNHRTSYERINLYRYLYCAGPSAHHSPHRCFSPKKREEAASPTQEPTYVPGIYTTSLMLNDRTVDIAVTVDENNINDIRMVNLDEAVTTMFPLLEPAFDDLANQIVRNQSVSDISYSDDNKYTSLVLLDAIKTSLGRAKPSSTPAE